MVYVVDVDDINGPEQNFTVNVTLRLRWKDERLAHKDKSARRMPLEEVWNPRLILANRQSLLRTSLPQVVEIGPDGSVTYRQQYVGPLSQPLSLKDFPLDTQDFNIHFVAPGSGPDEIEFVPDTIPQENITGGEMAKVLSLPDWRILNYTARTKPYTITKTLQVAGFAFEFVAKRHVSYYLWHVMLPLVLIVMMSWGPFLVNPTKAGLQLGVASSAVLTLIAYRFLLASLLPKLPYLTRLDYVTLSGTVLVFAAFLQVLLTSILAYGEHERLATWLDRSCRVAFPAVFAVLVAWSALG